MTTSLPQELNLTPDLLEYAKAVALKEAEKYCPRCASYGDAIQDALLHLVSRPPKFDPSRGASEKTLIYTIVQRAVIKFAARQVRHASRYKQFARTVEVTEGLEEGTSEGTPTHHLITERRTAELMKSGWSMDDMLRFIDNEESRALCKLVVDCGGNLSEAARRLGLSEGTVRHRLKMLGPKLLAAGFDPFSTGDTA